MTTNPIRLWLDDERDPRTPEIQQRFGAAGDEVWVRTVGEPARDGAGTTSVVNIRVQPAR